MTWLSPPVFADPALRPEGAAHYPAAGVYLDGAGLGAVVTRPDGVREEGPLGAGGHRVVVLPCPCLGGTPAPTARDWVGGVDAVRDAVAAAAAGRWEAFGRALDAAHFHERNALPPDGARDLAYAAGRSAGAAGGRAGEGVVAFVVLSDAAEQAVRGAVPCR